MLLVWISMLSLDFELLLLRHRQNKLLKIHFDLSFWKVPVQIEYPILIGLFYYHLTDCGRNFHLSRFLWLNSSRRQSMYEWPHQWGTKWLFCAIESLKSKVELRRTTDRSQRWSLLQLGGQWRYCSISFKWFVWIKNINYGPVFITFPIRRRLVLEIFISSFQIP